MDPSGRYDNVLSFTVEDSGAAGGGGTPSDSGGSGEAKTETEGLGGLVITKGVWVQGTEPRRL